MDKYYLSFDENWGLYVLTPHPQETIPDDASYSMLIRYDGGGEYSYKFVVFIDGEWFYVCTLDELNERQKDIAEHEGDEVARIWRTEQDELHVERDTHFIFKAQEYWEALTKVTALRLSMSHSNFPSKPMNAELVTKLDVAREKFYSQE